MGGYTDFLLAVVNAWERDAGAYRRDEFQRKYRPFFPANDAEMMPLQQAAYDSVRQWWIVPGKPIAREQPDSEYGFHVVTLRHMLRVIWAIADSGDFERAESKCKHLLTEVHRYLRLSGEDTALERWRQGLRDCVSELERQIRHLKLCENSLCDDEPYFVRHARAKYCSTACSAAAKQDRRRECNALKPPKPSKVSPEARRKMSWSATERWARERAEKGLRKYDYDRRQK